MSNKQQSSLRNMNRVFIFILTVAGLLMDGYQTADVLCSFALVNWLWLPQCIKFEAKALRYISSLDEKDEIAASLPDARLEIINKCGHQVHMDKPKNLMQVVSRFLND